MMVSEAAMPERGESCLRKLRTRGKNIVFKSLAAIRTETWMPVGHASILMYHGVLPAGQNSRVWSQVTAAGFKAQMEFIHRHYRPISLDELVRHLREGKALPPRAVVITFDDGRRNNAEVAAPILQRLSIPATFFAVSDFIGSSRMLWIDRLVYFDQHLAEHDPETWSDVLTRLNNEFAIDTPSDGGGLAECMKRTPFPVKERVMDWLASQIGEWDEQPETEPYMPMSVRQLQELDADPLFTIGAHTVSHEILSQCGPDEARRQIFKGKADLEAMLGHPVAHFAFPNGLVQNVNQTGRKLVAEAGFLSSCMAACGNVRQHHDPFDLPRIGIGNETINFDLMRLGLSGIYPAMVALSRRFGNGAHTREGVHPYEY